MFFCELKERPFFTYIRCTSLNLKDTLPFLLVRKLTKRHIHAVNRSECGVFDLREQDDPLNNLSRHSFQSSRKAPYSIVSVP